MCWKTELSPTESSTTGLFPVLTGFIPILTNKINVCLSRELDKSIEPALKFIDCVFFYFHLGITFTIITKCLREGEDSIVQHYAAKTIENVATTDTQYCEKFATPETAQVLLSVVNTSTYLITVIFCAKVAQLMCVSCML